MPKCAICDHEAKYLGVHVQRSHSIMPAQYAASYGPLFDDDVLGKLKSGSVRPLVGWADMRDAYDELPAPERMAFLASISTKRATASVPVEDELLAMPYLELLRLARGLGAKIPASGCQACVAESVCAAVKRRAGGADV